jgi:hypothetical protein
MQVQMTRPKKAKGNSQYSGYSTMPEALVKFRQMSPPSQSLSISLFTQYARTQDAPEALNFFSHDQVQEQMTCTKEAKGNSQDSSYSTTPEDMVKFGQTIPPPPALAISLITHDDRTQDAPEDLVFFGSNEQIQ